MQKRPVGGPADLCDRDILVTINGLPNEMEQEPGESMATERVRRGELVRGHSTAH